MLSEKELAELQSIKAREAELIEKLKQEDPFYYFEPSDGSITPEARSLLEKYIEKDDIPAHFDCQKDIFMCESLTVVAGGGNRVGKSTCHPIEVYIHGTGEVPYAMRSYYPASKLAVKGIRRVRVLGETNDVLKTVIIPKYKEWAPRNYLKKRNWDDSWSAESKVLSLYEPKTGKLCATIQFMSYEQPVKNMQGADLTMLVFDEEPPYNVYKENIMRVGTQNLRKLFAMTPTNGMTWVFNEIVQKADGKAISCFKLCSLINPHLNLTAFEDGITKINNYLERKMRILGEWVSLSGLVYGGLFNHRIHVIKPFEVTKEFLVVRGMDPHLVTPTAVVEAAVDRENNIYIIGCYFKPNNAEDTETVKANLAARVREGGYRLGWTAVDRSSDVDIKALGDKNVFQEFKRGANAIPALFKSQKFTGSIFAGVDEIKKYLRQAANKTGPGLYFFDTPENELLINSMMTLERDTYQNEDKKGQKDKIAEGKHHLHAAMRYIFQRHINWIPTESTPIYEMAEEDYI